MLNNKAFIGFENNSAVTSWLMATEKNNPIFKSFLNYYENKHFVMPNGKFDMLPNPQILTPILVKEKNLILNGRYQNLNNITIYPKDYFCPKNGKNGKVVITKNTYCIHHFNGSWLTVNFRIRNYIKKIMRKILGEKLTEQILILYRKL